MKNSSFLAIAIIISFPIHAQKPFKAFEPPNCVLVRDNFYADRTEVTNIDYREYCYWMQRVWGPHSKPYLNALPDTNVWIRGTDSICPPCVRQYFFTPKFNDFPVVGITYEQALNYSKWRSDRVYEMMLIGKGYIKPIPKQDSINCFTIERYLSGKYFSYKPVKSVPYPVYRLPSKEEWEYIASGGIDIKQHPFGIDETSKEAVKFRTKNIGLFNTREYASLRRSFTAIDKSFFPNPYQLYNTIGNVAEMTSAKGIAKGGSWCHTLKESQISHEQLYTTPTQWLGFRDVCSWKVPE